MTRFKVQRKRLTRLQIKAYERVCVAAVVTVYVCLLDTCFPPQAPHLFLSLVLETINVCVSACR